MKETTLDPLGVQIDDVDLALADDAAIARLVQLLGEHGVVIARGQRLDDAAFEAFLGRFGTPVFTAGETPVPGHASLNVVTNAGRQRPPRSVFHVDTTYVRHPPAYTALRAVEVPSTGGETLFSNQYRAFDTLSAELREHLAGRTVRHVVTGVDPGTEQEHEAAHPLFRTHPITGRTSLYLSTPQRCVSISGIGDGEAQHMITALYEHSTTPDNVLRHRWQPDDLVMWDNGCVLHKADHSGVVGVRTMHRGMVDGYAAPPPAPTRTTATRTTATRTTAP